MNWFSGQKLRQRCREQTYGQQGAKVVGGSGGVMNWEIGIDIYTLICIKWITNKNLLYKKINKIKNNAGGKKANASEGEALRELKGRAVMSVTGWYNRG